MNTSLTLVVASLLALVVWRKEATLVRNYWKAKSWLLLLVLSLLILSPVGAQESLSSYFVKITDASKAVKNSDQFGPSMKVWFVTIVRPIMDVLKQLFPSCVVAWKPSLLILTPSRLPLRT